jgi:hypothetical protein
VRTLSLLSSTVLSAAVLTACDSGVTEPPFLPETSPTPTDEATASLTAVPADLGSFREFVASEIAPAIAEGDGDTLLAHARPQHLTCDGAGLVPCDGLPEGTVLEGIYVTEWATDEVRIVPVSELAEDFGEILGRAPTAVTDDFGGARPALYALAAESVGQEGGSLYYAVVSAMQFRLPAMEDLVRLVRAYQFAIDTPSPAGWVMTGVVRTDTFAQEWLSGDCSECYDHWERWEGTP